MSYFFIYSTYLLPGCRALHVTSIDGLLHCYVPCSTLPSELSEVNNAMIGPCVISSCGVCLGSCLVLSPFGSYGKSQSSIQR
jgi:hypothetical protein